MPVDETLDEFKSFVSRLLSLEVSDPNMGVALAEEAISLINRYASDHISWLEFVQGAKELLDGGHEG